jgi:hypothetical protein
MAWAAGGVLTVADDGRGSAAVDGEGGSVGQQQLDEEREIAGWLETRIVLMCPALLGRTSHTPINRFNAIYMLHQPPTLSPFLSSLSGLLLQLR